MDTAKIRPTTRLDERRSGGSFLVRVWYESREVENGAPAFRAYVKNLQTGEERFLRDPERVKEHLLDQVEGLRVAPSNGHPHAADGDPRAAGAAGEDRR